MTLTNDYARGSQLWIHKIRMIGQAVSVNLKLALILGCLVSTYTLYKTVNPQEIRVLEQWSQAHLNLLVSWDQGKSATQLYESSSGRRYQVSSLWVLQSKDVNVYLNSLERKGIKALTYGGAVMASIVFGFFLFFLLRGKRNAPKIKDRGAILETSYHINGLLKTNQEQSDFTLGPLHLVKNKETSHILVTGTTGAGKTNCITTLLSQIREKHQRALVVDLTGSFVEKFYRPEVDILYNPFDSRSFSWDLWEECNTEFRLSNFVHGVVSGDSSGDTFWRDAARTVLKSGIQSCIDTNKLDIEYLHYVLTTAESKIYKDFLRGTEAVAYTNDDSDKMGASVRATLGNSVKFLKYFSMDSSSEEQKTLTIHNWVRQDIGDGWLFLTMMPHQREVLRPLITSLFNCGISSAMELPPHQERRLWFVIDELPAMQSLPILPTALAEIRKYGGCILAGIQSKPQLEGIYGAHKTAGLLDLFNTNVFFRSSEPSTTQWISKVLGDREQTESFENLSYGANTIRDGVSINQHHATKPVVLPTEISNLRDLEAYVKLPSGYPSSKIRMEFLPIQGNEPGFIEKKDMTSQESGHRME